MNDENYIAALVKIADLYQFEGDFETAISKLEEARELSDSPLITLLWLSPTLNKVIIQLPLPNTAKLSERKILQ